MRQGTWKVICGVTTLAAFTSASNLRAGKVNRDAACGGRGLRAKVHTTIPDADVGIDIDPDIEGMTDGLLPHVHGHNSIDDDDDRRVQSPVDDDDGERASSDWDGVLPQVHVHSDIDQGDGHVRIVGSGRDYDERASTDDGNNGRRRVQEYSSITDGDGDISIVSSGDLDAGASWDGGRVLRAKVHTTIPDADVGIDINPDIDATVDDLLPHVHVHSGINQGNEIVDSIDDIMSDNGMSDDDTRDDDGRASSDGDSSRRRKRKHTTITDGDKGIDMMDTGGPVDSASKEGGKRRLTAPASPATPSSDAIKMKSATRLT